MINLEHSNYDFTDIQDQLRELDKKRFECWSEEQYNKRKMDELKIKHILDNKFFKETEWELWSYDPQGNRLELKLSDTELKGKILTTFDLGNNNSVTLCDEVTITYRSFDLILSFRNMEALTRFKNEQGFKISYRFLLEKFERERDLAEKGLEQVNKAQKEIEGTWTLV